MENWLVIYVRLMPLYMMVMMVCSTAVERALRIWHLYRIFAHHLSIVRA